jgi:hypothetical protein
MARITGKANWDQGKPGSGAGDEGEYGGMPGMFQPPPHEIGDVDSVGEAAMILRTEGKRLAGVDTDLPADDLHADSAKEILDDYAIRMQGHSVSELAEAERLD